MESGAIPNSSLSASSSYAMGVGPVSARLRQEVSSGAWCPKQPIAPDIYEYLQVDLGRPHLVTAIATQGRYYSTKGQEYAEGYQIEYWRPGLGWKVYFNWDNKTILRGNSDTNTVVEQPLMPMIHATKVRIIPHSLIQRSVCLRVEIYGCPDDSGLIRYSAPPPSSDKGDHVDKKYDGWKDSQGNLKGGLGGLLDGVVGDNYFFLDVSVNKGNSWIAWRNSSFENNYMELLFEFGDLRNISQVDLFTNNYYSRDVQIFSKAVLYFSVGGVYFNGDPVVHHEKTDKTSERARNVTIHIPGGRLAKFLRICLYFNSEWIMLSEVYFHSEYVNMTIDEETEQKSFEHLLENSHTGNSDLNLSSSLSINIIVLLLIILISVLLLIFLPIVFIKKSNKYSSQSTASILRNTFNFNIKEMFYSIEETKAETEEECRSRISLGRRQAFEEGESAQLDSQTLTSLPYSYRQSVATLVTPGRAVITLAPKNLPNILQDGIHLDRFNLPDDYYRFHASNSRGEQLHYDAGMMNEERVSVFATNPHHFNSTMSENSFSMADTLHTRQAPNLKDSGAITIWNMSPAFRRSFPEEEVEINVISMGDLHPIIKIGSFGCQEIAIYEIEDDELPMADQPRIVQVKTVKIQKKDATYKEYMEELKYLGGLDHPSLCKLLGLVTSQYPPLAVFEYSHAGDLYQHLRNTTQPEHTRFPVLLSFILQICSAMKYLEARDTVHKDLAARNILIYPGNRIKVTDTAICSPLYIDHYYMQDESKPLPIRWLSWECTLLKRYTCPGTVWSFGITAWEILNLCSYFPFENLTINEIVKLAEDYLLKKEIREIHARPILCPDDLYKIMLNCWERKSKLRPTFKEIYIFLKSKYIDLVPINDQL